MLQVRYTIFESILQHELEGLCDFASNSDLHSESRPLTHVKTNTSSRCLDIGPTIWNAGACTLLIHFELEGNCGLSSYNNV